MPPGEGRSEARRGPAGMQRVRPGAARRARCRSAGSTAIPALVGLGFGAFYLFSCGLSGLAGKGGVREVLS